MAMLSIVAMMYVSQINVCLHRLMFAKKEGLVRAWCDAIVIDKNAKLDMWIMLFLEFAKCCCYFSSFIVRLSAIFTFNLRVSYRNSTWRNLIERGVKSSSSSFRWSKGHQHATNCMYTYDVLTTSIFTRSLKGGGGDGEDVGGLLPSLVSKLVFTMQPPPKKS